MDFSRAKERTHSQFNNRRGVLQAMLSAAKREAQEIVKMHGTEAESQRIAQEIVAGLDAMIRRLGSV